MHLDLQQIKLEYDSSRGNREVQKWVFALCTFGLGALYLWATTQTIAEGEIGIRETASGKMVLLPHGRHSNFPWESYPVDAQPLSKKVIEMGPFKIITVDTGYVAKTYNKGKLEILPEGQHIISDASHTYGGLIPIKQETKKLHQVVAYTSDNVGLTMQADVRYQIIDPAKAVGQINNIEESIKEIAEISISQIVSHHTLGEFAPATSSVTSSEHHGISDLLIEIKRTINEQLILIGIKLLNIGITSWNINDAQLAHELGQGAVVKSQTQSKLLSAENAAKVKNIEAEAEGKAIVTRAKAEATAIEERGNAYIKIAESMQKSPGALSLYQLSQQSEMVAHAKNANLFFTQKSDHMPAVIATIPTAPTPAV